MKSHPHKEVRCGCFVHLDGWDASSGLPSAISCPLAVLRARSKQLSLMHFEVFGPWQQDLGFCSRLDDLMIHQEIVGNNLLTTVIMLYGTDPLKCF